MAKIFIFISCLARIEEVFYQLLEVLDSELLKFDHFNLACPRALSLLASLWEQGKALPHFPPLQTVVYSSLSTTFRSV